MLETKTEMKESCYVIELKGELDISTVDRLLTAVETIPAQTDAVYFDFLGIQFIDSTGIGTLVQVMKNLRNNKKNVKYTRIPKDIYEILEVLGIPEIMGSHSFECLN